MKIKKIRKKSLTAHCEIKIFSKMPLNSLSIVHLLLGIPSTLENSLFSGEAPLEKMKFSIVSVSQLAVAPGFV